MNDINAKRKEFISEDDYQRYLANVANVKRATERSRVNKSLIHNIASLLDDHKYYDDYQGPVSFTNLEQAVRILDFLRHKKLLNEQR